MLRERCDVGMVEREEEARLRLGGEEERLGLVLVLGLRDQRLRLPLRHPAARPALSAPGRARSALGPTPGISFHPRTNELARSVERMYTVVTRGGCGLSRPAGAKLSGGPRARRITITEPHIFDAAEGLMWSIELRGHPQTARATPSRRVV